MGPEGQMLSPDSAMRQQAAMMDPQTAASLSATQPRHPAVHGNISMHMRGSGDCDATGRARPFVGPCKTTLLQ